MIMAFGTVLSYYSKHLMPRVSMKELSLIGAIPPFCLLSLALFWGRLLDAGHHRILNSIAGVLVTGGFIGMAFTGGQGRVGDGKYWAILLAVIPVGIGQSIYFLAAPHMAKTWFPRHKGFSMGITNSGAAVGGALFPISFTEMIGRHSFQAAVGVFAAISGVLAIFIVWAAVPAPAFQRRQIGKKSSVSTWWPERAFASWTFRVLTIAMCFVYLGTLTVPFYIELWAQKRKIGVSEDSVRGQGILAKPGNLTVYLVVILNSCQLPGRWLGSTMCDYIAARKVHCVATLANAVLIYAGWLRSRDFASAAVFAGLFGFLLGIMVSLPVNNVQEVLGDRMRLFGQYSGAMYTCAAPFMLCGAVVAGAMVDSKEDGITGAGIWAASVFLAGGLLIFVSLLIPNDTYNFDEPKTEANPGTWTPDEPTSPAQHVSGAQAAAVLGSRVQAADLGSRQSAAV
ncbi:hypothetical protein DV737_g1783, partial [Chaetothyriales sp. CBS 132003]